MSDIKVLPPELISKIAAGEVVERPASVVKEMLENSIDAGATEISIDIKDAGRTEILIKDNGSGIAKNDLEQMFQRHATSKIKNLDDLFNIHSLGFRGEALYSIGAIADVTVETKHVTSETGWQLHLRGGVRQSLKPCAQQKIGTMISVKELFFNTPARRKFMKTDTTEFNQITSVVIPYALLHKHLGLTLTHNGKTVLNVRPTDDHLRRVADVLKVDEKFLLETNNGTQLRLILGDMNLRRPRRDLQYLFVNGRPVQNKNISFALSQAYRLILPPDEFPVFVAMIDIPAEDVDANVHPTKREVKIREEQNLCSELRHLCERALMTSGHLKTVESTLGYSSKLSFLRKQEPSVFENDITSKDAGSSSESRMTNLYPSAGVSTNYAYPSVKASRETLFDSFGLQPTADSLQKKLAEAKLIGIFRTKYVLWENGSSLLLMDQHAAAERINYETLIVQMEKGQVDVQRLLSPVTLKLMPQDMTAWEESKDALDELGFATDLWQDDTIAIHSHPRVIIDIEQTVRHILAGGHLAKADHEKIARRACRCSIMTGDALKKEEAESLRTQLLKCLDPLTCPHGRPTVVEMTEGFLDRQFLRT